MTMVCGLDLHRRQITFDALEVESGQVWTGRVWQPDRERFRRWLRDDVTERAHGGSVAIAVEGCTGWRYVVEEVVAAGLRSAPGGAGRYAGGAWSQAARQDRSHRQSVVARVVGRWSVAGVVDPADGGVGVARTGAALQDVGRSAFDVGAADPCRAVSARGDAAGELDPLGGHPRVARRRSTRGQPGGPAADPDGVSDDRRDHDRVAAVEGRPAALRNDDSRAVGRWSTASTGSAGCWRWRCGPSSATVNGSHVRSRWCATAVSTSPSTPRIGDAPAGSLSRQGPQTLRWALYEAAKNASHQRSPDHDYYADVKEHLNSKLATISMARKLARRCFHMLRAVDPDIVYATP